MSMPRSLRLIMSLMVSLLCGPKTDFHVRAVLCECMQRVRTDLHHSHRIAHQVPTQRTQRASSATSEWQ
eukprot:1022218-Alexandrium_andersonii.AAC.1